jgi:hypothetical protein
VITWSGAVVTGVPVTITFSVTVDAGISGPEAIVNTALVDDGLGNVWQRRAALIVNGYTLHLPTVMRND